MILTANVALILNRAAMLLSSTDPAQLFDQTLQILQIYVGIYSLQPFYSSKSVYFRFHLILTKNLQHHWLMTLCRHN